MRGLDNKTKTHTQLETEIKNNIKQETRTFNARASFLYVNKRMFFCCLFITSNKLMLIMYNCM